MIISSISTIIIIIMIMNVLMRIRLFDSWS